VAAVQRQAEVTVLVTVLATVVGAWPAAWAACLTQDNELSSLGNVDSLLNCLLRH